MTAQTRLEFPELEPTRRDPLKCPHLIRMSGPYAVCGLKDGEIYTNCQQSICGEPPRCVHDPVDNSPAAMARRRAWMAGH